MGVGGVSEEEGDEGSDGEVGSELEVSEVERGEESILLEIGSSDVSAFTSDGGSGGGGGGSTGPSQPSCRPRMYSFQVWRPMMRSPWTPSHC